MEKIIVQKLHEIEEKEHGKILLAGQWILESEIAGLREKAGKYEFFSEFSFYHIRLTSLRKFFVNTVAVKLRIQTGVVNKQSSSVPATGFKFKAHARSAATA